MTINRRSFIQTAAAVTASLSAPMVMASGKPRVVVGGGAGGATVARYICLLYTSPSPRDRTRSRMPSSA